MSLDLVTRFAEMPLGSMVRHKTGGPTMVVVEHDSSDGTAMCEWAVSRGDFKQKWFSIYALQLTNEE